jgi:hypothetical protein
MKSDVLALAALKMSSKKPSKETLNHPGLISLASGLNPYRDTKNAYLKAYESLGIDIINRVPEENASEPLHPGEVAEVGGGYTKSYLGLFDSYTRVKFPFKDVDDFFAAAEIDLDYQKLITPVPHRLEKLEIERKMALLGDIGLYYYMLYTTLFMWGVEVLGWEVFMLASSLDPVRFREKFLAAAFQKSRAAIELLAGLDTPFVFVHDDLANARGPVFSPKWYDAHIFPKYCELWAPAKKAGKKVIFVADGNMAKLIRPLKETGIDGVMFENPATDFDLILKEFGDQIFIGGIETGVLTFGSPEEIQKHVSEVHAKVKGIPGFAMSTPGGIHGNIPLINLEAYFDARARWGYTPENWRAAG